MRRRSFIHTLGAWLGAAAVVVLSAPLAGAARYRLRKATRTNSPSDDEVRRRISSLFSFPRSAILLGAHFLRTVGRDAGRDRLLADAGFVLITPADDGALRAAFADARRADFAAGRVVLVDGWVLARSEVACCALLASMD